MEKLEPDVELQNNYQPETVVSKASTSMATIKIPEAELVNEYQPETEEALIDYVNNQNNKLEMVNILVKWEIGRCINSYYKGKYGTDELGKISEATGIGRDTLAKVCKFAKQYSREHVDMLLREALLYPGLR